MAKKTYGLLAEFGDVTTLVRACEKVRDAGYQSWDAYTPFPVHGIDPAMGIKTTRLPWLVFWLGITGTITALVMQWWMNAIDYPFDISNKPFWSLPANVPVIFELTVLFAAVGGAFLGTLIINGFPRHHHPLFGSARFARATNDGFFIAIEAADERFDGAKTEALLKDAGATAVESVLDDSDENARIPFALVAMAVASMAAVLVPVSAIYMMRATDSQVTRIHPNPNMDKQERFNPQGVNTLFADGRAMRAPVAEVVPVGEALLDDAFEHGIRMDAEGTRSWLTGLPAQVALNEVTLDRGQNRFNIYCSPCHGLGGYGDGPVHERATKLKQEDWIAPTSMHAEHLRSMPEGKLFNTISNGIRNMPSYGHAIPQADRWAIVAYIRALQRSQYSALEDVEPEFRAQLQ